MNVGIAEEEMVSDEQYKNYWVALKKLFLYQSGRGFWGRGNIDDRFTYTSQCVQLMQALGIDHNAKNFKKAVRWLEDNVDKLESHRATRIEIGLKIGDTKKLANDSCIDGFLDDLEYDMLHPKEKPRLDFFWEVIPILIAMHPYEQQFKRTIPHEKVIHYIEDNVENFGDTITVQFQANFTGLVALYLATIQDNFEVSEYRDKMVKWLFANREENASRVSWQDGRGITSYVLLDLLGCNLEGDTLKKITPKILGFITPNSKGNVPKDNVKTFETKLHGESLYASILVLRAMTEVLKMENSSKLQNIDGITNHTWFEALRAKIIRFFYYNKKRMPLIICMVLCLIGGLCYFFKEDFLGNLFFTIGASSALTFLLQFFDKE